MRHRLLASVLLLAAASPPTAASGAFVESTDLSNAVASPTAIPAFTLGLNTVAGSVNFDAHDPGDFFRIALPANSALTAVRVTLSNVVSQDAGSPNVGLITTVTVGSPLLGGNSLANNGAVYNFGNSVPAALGAEVFGSTAGASTSAGVPFSAYCAYDYAWEFEVALIPAPSSAAALGLAGLLAARRPPRRR